jgi:hypothetical protein
MEGDKEFAMRDEIELHEFCQIAGVTPDNLVKWRYAGLPISEPRLPSLGRSGRRSYMPRNDLVVVGRIKELARQYPRKRHLWHWHLYCEGHRIDIKSWALPLIPTEQQVALTHAGGGAALAKSKTVRAPVGRQLSNQLRNILNFTAFLDAWLAVLAGNERYGDLYIVADSGFDLLRKAIDLPPVKTRNPDLAHAFNRLDLSPSGLRKAVAEASSAEVERCRRYLQVVAKLTEVSAARDPAALDAATKWLESGKLEPPSIRARRAQRKRPASPPKLVATLNLLWDEPVGCAVIFAALLAVCSEPSLSKIVSEFFALVVPAAEFKQ